MTPRYISRAPIVPAHDISCRAAGERYPARGIVCRWHLPDFSDLPADCRPEMVGGFPLWSARVLLRYAHEVRRRRARHAAACRWARRKDRAKQGQPQTEGDA
jgi:hypothetical protein